MDETVAKNCPVTCFMEILLYTHEQTPILLNKWNIQKFQHNPDMLQLNKITLLFGSPNKKARTDQSSPLGGKYI